MNEIGPAALADHQLNILFRPVNPQRVSQVRGMAHMEAWDIRRELIRVFGFGGWNLETMSLDLVTERETKNGDRSRWTVVYRAQVRLTVKDLHGREIARYEDGAAGDSVNQPSLGDAHDMAMKTALSQAMKRCAVNLGDQFGLSLYNNGSAEPVVGWSAAHPPKENPAPAPEVPADPPVLPEPQPAPVAQDPDRAAALAEMWDVAERVGFADGLPAKFVESFGHPVEEGTAEEFRQARDLMAPQADAA